jgi:hypothetical protein
MSTYCTITQLVTHHKTDRTIYNSDLSVWKGWVVSRMWKKQTLWLALFTLFWHIHEVWYKYGLSDITHLSAVQQKHSKSQTHVQCCLTSKLFGKEQRVDLRAVVFWVIMPWVVVIPYISSTSQWMPKIVQKFDLLLNAKMMSPGIMKKWRRMD